MISLPTKQVRDFLSKSSFIPGNNIIPVCDTVRLDCQGNKARLTRNTGSLYCSSLIDYVGDPFEPMLLNHSILTKEAQYAGETVDVSETATQVRINKTLFGKTDSIFMADPAPGEVSVHFSNEVLAALHVAKSWCGHIDGTKVNEAKYMVHIHDRSVGAFNGAGMYFKDFPELPADLTMKLSPHAIKVISGLNEPLYRSCGNMDVFQCGNDDYGFGVQHGGPIQMRGQIGQMSMVEWRNIPVKDLLIFCEIVEATCIDKVYKCDLTDTGDGIGLTYTNGALNIVSEREVPAEPHGDIGIWTFNTLLLRPLLASLPYDRINIATRNGYNNNMLFITCVEDKDFKAAVAGMA